MRQSWSAVALLAALGAVRAQSTPAAPTTRPNLVLFLVDDLGFCDTAVPMQGEPNPLHRRWHTPQVARLAREGVRFAQAYAAAPVCSPTRAALLTGRNPARTHITYWLLHPDRDTSAAHPRLLPPPWNRTGLTPADTTLPRLLRDAGYRTIHVGKAHVGAVGTPGADPRNLGFDVNVAGHGAGAPGSYQGRDGFRQTASRPSVWDVPGLERYHGQNVWLDDVLAQEAVAEVRRAVAAHTPFFLQLAPYGVHVPIQRNPRYAAHYADLDPTEAAYGTMIESVDAALGTVLDALDQLGVADQTLVVFTSDNGGLSAHGRGRAPDGATRDTHNLPLRSGKGSAYEGGLRVPLVVRWPGVVSADQRCDQPVISQDWFATFLAAAQVAAPEPHDGQDLTPLLRQPNSALAPRLLGWHQPHFWGVAGPGIAPFSAVRRGNHKLVWFHDGRVELFDLRADPGEQHDLAAQEPALATELASALAAWLRANDAQDSRDKATGAAVPGPVAALAAQQAAASRPASRPDPRGADGVVWFDLSQERSRQVVVDREPGQYLGHVTTVLLDDGQTVLAVYPKGHGRGAIVMKRSSDGGRTWSERLPVPASWAGSQEVPTLHRVVDAAGQRRLILWSGLNPARLAVSDDDVHWSELRAAGAWGGIVVMGSLLPLGPPGHYAAWFHDDGRYLAAGGKASGVFTLLQTESRDGGLSWSEPRALFASRDVHLCEPGAVRSDDGRQLALLLRENARRKRSHVMFSDDQARTWSTPRELPLTLTGDRHTAVRTPDGRLVITFRDRTLARTPDANADLDKLGQGSPTEGDWVAWVGRYDDLVHGRAGQYRVRLMDNTRGWDCAYPGLEVLADGTLVATTYGHWDAGQPPYIVCVRFRLDELDARARR